MVLHFYYIVLLSIGFLLPANGVSAHGMAHLPPKKVKPSSRHNPAPPEEVFLSFQYRGSGTEIIGALYENGKFYLPVNQLFDALLIPYEIDNSQLRISGTYLSQDQSYELYFRDYDQPYGQVGETRISFNAEDFIVGELGFYLLPKHFQQLFGLNFAIDTSSLALRLKTKNVLPIQKQEERERRRRQIDQQRARYDYYPLAYNRERKVLGGAFLDYSINASAERQALNQYNYNLSGGAEILGGDIQGLFFGAYNENAGFSSRTDNVRWRYVTNQNKALSSISVGQLNSDGVIGTQINGINITNRPVQPRTLFQDYIIDGNTLPQSEVELYRNNTLIAFKEADANGYYRFKVPLTYGVSRLNVRIFGPNGSVQERDQRIEVPFRFLRKGEVQYNVSGGRAESFVLNNRDNFWQLQSSASLGLSSRITAQAGVDYYDLNAIPQPLPHGSVSTRLGSKYLLNVEAVPSGFYQIDGSVIFPSSTSINTSFTHFQEDQGILNTRGAKQSLRTSIYVPFRFLNIPFNFRLTGEYRNRDVFSTTRYRTFLSSRFGRLNLRFGYSDQQAGPLELRTTPSSNLRTTATYIFPRGPSAPGILKGMFLQTQLEMNPDANQFEEADIQLSRDILREGRLQLSVGRDFRTGINFTQLNFTFDFNKIRTSTVARSRGDNVSITQNIRGSVAYDHNFKKLHLGNRQLVGQSGIAVRMFVDENNSGSFDEGEKILPYNAVRLDQASRTQVGDDGIIRITQLQPYEKHNIEINKAAIKDPILVPQIEEFSFRADPNQFKQIDIPFYRTGIIEGKVVRKQKNGPQPLGGVRLFLVSEDSSFTKELRTFSDGSFYTYEVPPGSYQLNVDQQQLDFLNAESTPDTLDIDIEAVAEGDLIEDLRFTITSQSFQPDSAKVAPQNQNRNINEKTVLTADNQPYYQIQIGSFKTRSKSQKVAQTVTAKTKSPFSLIYSSKNKLFGIRGPNIDDRKLAIETAYSYSQNNYPRAALVILTKDSTFKSNAIPKITDDTDFRFQLYVAKHSKLHTGRVATLIQEYPGLRLNQTGEEMLIIDNIQRWKHLENLKNELSQIPSVQKVIRVIVQDK